MPSDSNAPAVVGLVTGCAVALGSWALRRLGVARDREVKTMLTLAEVRTRLESLSPSLERLDARIVAQEQLFRQLADGMHGDVRKLATDLAELRASLDAHVAQAHHGTKGAANG